MINVLIYNFAKPKDWGVLSPFQGSLYMDVLM